MKKVTTLLVLIMYTKTLVKNAILPTRKTVKLSLKIPSLQFCTFFYFPKKKFKTFPKKVKNTFPKLYPKTL